MMTNSRVSCLSVNCHLVSFDLGEHKRVASSSLLRTMSLEEHNLNSVFRDMVGSLFFSCFVSPSNRFISRLPLVVVDTFQLKFSHRHKKGLVFSCCVCWEEELIDRFGVEGFAVRFLGAVAFCRFNKFVHFILYQK